MQSAEFVGFCGHFIFSVETKVEYVMWMLFRISRALSIHMW